MTAAADELTTTTGCGRGTHAPAIETTKGDRSRRQRPLERLATTMGIGGIRAVIFDMDGTLIDSEIYTERAVEALLAKRGIDFADLDLRQFHGITWEQTAALLVDAFPVLADQPLTTELHASFHAAFARAFPPLIDGAREAVLAASRVLPLAIATSSNRASVEQFVQHFDLRSAFCELVAAEDYGRSKPDPECYLLAAARLGHEPARCLVFEDSIVGLQAAKAAGMWAVAITGVRRGAWLDQARRIADHAIRNYLDLPGNFFTTIGKTAAS